MYHHPAKLNITCKESRFGFPFSIRRKIG